MGSSGLMQLLNLLELKCESEHHQFNNISEHGATVVISNHPTVIDGLSLIRASVSESGGYKNNSQSRFANYIPQVSELTIGIENMAGKMSHKNSAR